MEKILILKNSLYWKKNYIEKLLVFKTTCIEKLLGFKNWLYCIEKLLVLKNHFKHPKRRNHKKYVIRSFHIYVQYLYTNGNYKMVA